MKKIVLIAIALLMGAVASQGQESVDLGLSVKWATYNVGANAVDEYGDFFAWGEICSKECYLDSTYADRKYKYPPEIASTQLDAATQLWGEDWRMPTAQEMQELLGCKWEWTAINDVKGYKITGKNGNHIFLPASGAMEGERLVGRNMQGYYASSQEGNSNPAYCYFLYMQSDQYNLRAYFRNRGWNIRPILNDNAARRSLSRQKEEGELTLGWFYKLIA